METKQIWLDTTVYQDEEFFDEEFFDDYFNDEKEYFKEKMENFISRYEKRYHTNVDSFLLISERESFYGDWNPAAGRVGYRLIQDLDGIFGMSSDDVKIYVGSDNFIHVDFIDYDGADYSVVELIACSIEEKVYGDVGSYACELDYVEMLQKQGKIKPTKFLQEK